MNNFIKTEERYSVYLQKKGIPLLVFSFLAALALAGCEGSGGSNNNGRGNSSPELPIDETCNPGRCPKGTDDPTPPPGPPAVPEVPEVPEDFALGLFGYFPYGHYIFCRTFGCDENGNFLDASFRYSYKGGDGRGVERLSNLVDTSTVVVISDLPSGIEECYDKPLIIAVWDAESKRRSKVSSSPFGGELGFDPDECAERENSLVGFVGSINTSTVDVNDEDAMNDARYTEFSNGERKLASEGCENVQKWCIRAYGKIYDEDMLSSVNSEIRVSFAMLDLFAAQRAYKTPISVKEALLLVYVTAKRANGFTDEFGAGILNEEALRDNSGRFHRWTTIFENLGVPFEGSAGNRDDVQEAFEDLQYDYSNEEFYNTENL